VFFGVFVQRGKRKKKKGALLKREEEEEGETEEKIPKRLFDRTISVKTRQFDFRGSEGR